MQHRLDVALCKCFFCQKDDQLAIGKLLTTAPHGHGRIEQAAHGKVLNMDPCHKCRGFMKQGVILITIDPVKSGEGWNKPPAGEDRRGWMPNPYRTGGWCRWRGPIELSHPRTVRCRN